MKRVHKLIQHGEHREQSAEVNINLVNTDDAIVGSMRQTDASLVRAALSQDRFLHKDVTEIFSMVPPYKNWLILLQQDQLSN